MFELRWLKGGQRRVMEELCLMYSEAKSRGEECIRERHEVIAGRVGLSKHTVGIILRTLRRRSFINVDKEQIAGFRGVDLITPHIQCYEDWQAGGGS